jgi:hypothetical protein
MYFSPSPPIFELEGKIVRIHLYRNGECIKSLEIPFEVFSSHEKTRIAQWLNSAFKGSSMDPVTYVPCFVFEGDAFKIVFFKNFIVLNYREKPDSAWTQFSRKKMDADHEIQLILEKFLP